MSIMKISSHLCNNQPNWQRGDWSFVIESEVMPADNMSPINLYPTVASLPSPDLIAKMKKEIVQLKRRYTTTDNEFKSELTRSITTVVEQHSHFGHQKGGKLISDVAWEVCEGPAKESIVKHSTQWIRQNLYSPATVLKAMDIAGGTLGQQGVEFGDHIVHWKYVQTEYGEGV
eukprot:scaffold210768_cov66-Attheya_sp.AAC.3